MLLPHALPVVPGSGFGELFAKPVDLRPGLGQLTIDEPQLRDHHLDVGGSGLRRTLGYAQGRLAQLTDHMRCVEAAYAMALENTRNGRLVHTRSLLGCWYGFPEV